MAACSAATLLASGRCFTCLTEKQLDVVIVELLRQWLGSSPTPAELLASGACLNCLDTKQIEIVKVQLLCTING
jgi:hypothetical protein